MLTLNIKHVVGLPSHHWNTMAPLNYQDTHISRSSSLSIIQGCMYFRGKTYLNSLCAILTPTRIRTWDSRHWTKTMSGERDDHFTIGMYLALFTEQTSHYFCRGVRRCSRLWLGCQI